MATIDWNVVADPHVALPMISDDNDLLFLGDELLDMYGDAIDSAATTSDLVPNHYSHDIPVFPTTDFTPNGLVRLVSPQAWEDTGSHQPTKPPTDNVSMTPSSKRRRSPAATQRPSANKKARVATPPRQDAMLAGVHDRGAPDDKVATSTAPSHPSARNNACTSFKTHAQVAVSDLLQQSPKGVHAARGTIDTSTAHVRALTSETWVAGASEGAAPAKPGRTRRSDLTSDERAKQNRDRNREHARNTRLRKKAYVDELKKTLVEVVAQRDAAELTEKQAVQRKQEQREVRYCVIREFLKLRGQSTADSCRWSAILEEDFKLTLPATAYRGTVCPCDDYRQILQGVDQCMADAANLSSFLQKLGTNVVLHYKCDRQGFLMDGDSVFLEWEASTVGSVKPLTFPGSLRCRFSPVTNKLHSVNLFFDSGSVALQVESATVTVGSASSSASISKEDSSVEEPNQKELEVPLTIELSSSEFL